MSAGTGATLVDAAPTLVSRLRFGAAVAAVWALLHFAAAPWTAPAGSFQPVTFVRAVHPMGGVVLAIVMVFAVAAAAVLAGGAGPRRALLTFGWGVALWLFERGQAGGTMQSWLIAQNEVPGPPQGGPYALLLVDYLWLAGVLLAGAVVASRLSLAAAGGPSGSTAPAPAPAQGASALLVATVVGAVVASILFGPALNATLRLQVYFAVAVGLGMGVVVAAQLLRVRDIRWYLGAPIALGVVGLGVAAAYPSYGLPPAYRELDTLPAWSLAKPLPIEMVSVGLIAIGTMLKPKPGAAHGAGGPG